MYDRTVSYLCRLFAADGMTEPAARSLVEMYVRGGSGAPPQRVLESLGLTQNVRGIWRPTIKGQSAVLGGGEVPCSR